MGSRWPEARVEDLAVKIAMGPFGSNIKVETFVSSGVPIISGQHLHEFRLNEASGFNFITEEHANKLANSVVGRGDVVFTHAGSIGQVAYVPENSLYERYVISQRQFYMRCNTSRVIPEYVTYYFRSSQGRHQLLANASSSGVPSIARPATYLRSLYIPVPPIEVQKAVARTLGALDDKIELNRRMADSLDEIAKTLFRLWFVEPAGHAWPSGGDGLPEGWKVERLGEHVDAVRGLSYSSANLGEPGEGLPMHNLNSISFARGYQPSGLKWFMGPHKDRNRAVAGELLVANVDVTQNLEVIGSPAIVPLRFGDDSVFSADLFRVDLKAGAPLTVRYLYMLLRDPRFHRIVVGFANGTTVNHLPSDALSVPRIVVPPRDLVHEFDKVVRPMLERRDELESESDTLREIRDTLLPPLLDGRIEVPASADGEAS